VAAGMVCTIPLTGPRISFYSEVMRLNPGRVAAVDKVLAALPADADITATTWFAVHLYRRERVYMFPNYYPDSRPPVTQYLLCKPEEVIDRLADYIEDNDYLLLEETAFVRVYAKEIQAGA